MDKALRDSIVWSYIQKARRPRNTITISGSSGSTNGSFVISSLAEGAYTNTISVSVPGSYGSTLNLGTNHQQALPRGLPGMVDPRALERRRAREKAARKARKRNRR